jgi:hypothetical protein
MLFGYRSELARHVPNGFEKATSISQSVLKRAPWGWRALERRIHVRALLPSYRLALVIRHATNAKDVKVVATDNCPNAVLAQGTSATVYTKDIARRR